MPSVSAACVWRRAAVLELSAAPDDPHSPLVCFDERPDQRRSEVRQPLPVTPRPPIRDDDASRREGTCHVVLCCEPRQGWRHGKVTDRRPAQACAPCLQDVVAVHVPQAAVISVVWDNVHTPTPAALEATFPPAEACRLWRKLDVHETPTHGSWRKRADIEVAVGSTPWLDRRLADQEKVRHAIAAWATRRHAATATVDWRLTTTQARRPLTPIYP